MHHIPIFVQVSETLKQEIHSKLSDLRFSIPFTPACHFNYTFVFSAIVRKMYTVTFRPSVIGICFFFCL